MKIRFILLAAAMLPLMACGDSVGAAAEANAPARSVVAAKPSDAGAGSEARAALAAKIPGARPEDLRETPVSGIYELAHDGDLSYVTADAKYVFSGDLFQVTARGDFPNLSEARRNELRVARLDAVPETEMLVFGPADARHTITVFTDIDCPWCRKLHSQVADYNKLGIRVRYLFFPRSGPDTESWYKAEAVWCARDRNKALTMAKNDQRIEMKRCTGNPVARDYELGRQVGVTGTPGIVLENGELVPGYLAPKDMLAHIENSLKAAKQSN
jgi:thiol:disulfide interchange protein DsbC